MALFPGLSDDLGRECLVRVPYSKFSTISSVCKAWKSELQSPEFYLRRKQTCNIQKVIVVAHQWYSHSPCQFALLEPETGAWSLLPTCKDLFNEKFSYHEVVSCRSGFVLLAWAKLHINVFVFDFLSFTWRRGATYSDANPVAPGSKSDGVTHEFTSDGDHMVYVLCDETPEFRSIIAYDTKKDKWSTLSRMMIISEDRLIFHRGKIHVIHLENFFTKRQFDVSTLQWDLPQEVTVKLSCVTCDDNGEWYGCSYDGNVLALRASTWEAIAKLPSEVRHGESVTVWKSKLAVLCFVEMLLPSPYVAYVLDLKNKLWTTVPNTPSILRYISSACSLEI